MAKSKSIAVPSGRGGYESVSVRPIDNGFIICRSTDNSYTETYSAKKPKIEVPAQTNAPKAQAKPNALSAVKRTYR